MMLLDPMVRAQISEALGWTLIHSLWEGIVIAAALAALLVTFRSPRIRYVAGCVALLATLASFAITLIHFLPESGGGARTQTKMTLAPWGPLRDLGGGSSRFTALDTLVPGLAPVWMVGVCLFTCATPRGGRRR